MDHHILHLGIVNSLLGMAAPRFLGAGVVGIDSDEVHLFQIDEFNAARVFHAAAHDEVQLVHGAAL